jgi:hypothetical protein
MNTLNTAVLYKFSGLMFFLKRSKHDFEMVADEIENYTLKSALNGLSEESSYYANELKNYLKHLGINTSTFIDTDLTADDFKDVVLITESFEQGLELKSLISYKEKYLTKAYSELLEEQMPCKSLHEIISYQLYALKISFQKIQTLNTARFAMY